jgi:hypothetical protein
MAEHLPAGWYVDPADAHQYRWWAGDQWTTHVRDKAEVDIAAAEAEAAAGPRPLPDFDAVPADATGPAPDGKRRVPVLLAVAILVGIVAMAGIVSFRPSSAGRSLGGEIRVPASDVAGLTRRAARFLGDGAACGQSGGQGVGAGTTVMITNPRGDELGSTQLGTGTVDRTLNPTTCVFPYRVQDLGEARVYVVRVGQHAARRAKADTLEAAGWTFDLRLG